MLDGFQAGLAWITVLRKRDEFRKAFRGFDPAKVAELDEADIVKLLDNPGIIRSRAKIEATIGGARSYLRLEAGGVSFSDFIWKMAGGKPIQRKGPVLPKTALSEDVSKVLKKHGFKFVGPVIVYAWMQAVGIVNDHDADCFRQRDVRRMSK